MSTATRSRTRTRSHLPRSQSHQAGIQQFAKTSKPGALPSSKSLLLDGEKPSCQLTASPSKKRKLNEIAATTINENSTQSRPDLSVEDTPSKTLKFSDLSVSTPRSSRTRPVATPTRSKTTRTRSLPKQPIFKKSTSTPNIAQVTATKTYPAALGEFLDLHSAFLKALSLHSAHNEYSASADLRELCPSIEKIWKKRKVTAKDVQRLVQVWDEACNEKNNDDQTEKKSDSSNLRFRLANYGLGKVCIERLDVSGSGSQGMFDENQFQERFVQIIEKKWRDQIDAQKDGENKDETDTPFEIENLPLAPIQACLTPFNTFRKGQQRLQDLKGGVIKVKTAMMKAASITPGEPGTSSVARDPTADRRKGLFERIKNKELLQSKLGPAPTKEQLLRRSAAQRAEDVARVLALLRPSYTTTANNDTIVAQRKPFSWQTLIQTIRDSLRNPIPAEEIAACLDMLAQKDVAGDWIDVVTIGSLKSVVLMSARDISPKEIGLKVSKVQF
ncbi:uncharacterized protein BHQ10_000245 [Talaromyces amestolkiae]|uniref:DNA replication factor Cdt1 C-terminal domain-containing protein n=1 Tax=Talaromyces amestolkiae TaxID=1196081 RepID=A0A364KL15_TALAM|nr:uncharacterized protein BHQ10_000245 [Talaromyces amestolkiae]RAO64233.1 hypothetical protein BHQ10_000245 [Talaromyces amestolkiae]